MDRRLAALLISLVLACACGDKVESKLDELGGDLKDAFERGGSSATAAQQSVIVADTLFDFDPTLDPVETAEANAQHILQHVQNALGECGSVEMEGDTSVKVSFGDPPGCTLKSGVSISGQVRAGVERTEQTISVTLIFEDLVVNGKDLSGSLTFVTPDGSTFSITGALESGSSTIQVTLAVEAESGTFKLSGTAEVTYKGTQTALTFTEVVYNLTECYPESGTLKIQRPAVDMTITFSEESADSGDVTASVGPKTYDLTLPAYGNCPKE